MGDDYKTWLLNKAADMIENAALNSVDETWRDSVVKDLREEATK